MDPFFEEIQGESKAEATRSNYSRQAKAFKIWLQQSHSTCWDDDDIFQIGRVTTHQICEYISITSVKDGKMLSYATPESNHSSIIDMYKVARRSKFLKA